MLLHVNIFFLFFMLFEFSSDYKFREDLFSPVFNFAFFFSRGKTINCVYQ